MNAMSVGYAIDMDESIGQDIHMDSDTLQTIILPIPQDFKFFSWWTLSLPSDKAPLCASTDRDPCAGTHTGQIAIAHANWQNQLWHADWSERALSEISMPDLNLGTRFHHNSLPHLGAGVLDKPNISRRLPFKFASHVDAFFSMDHLVMKHSTHLGFTWLCSIGV